MRGCRGSARRSDGSASRAGSRSRRSAWSTSTGISTRRNWAPDAEATVLAAKLRHLGPDVVVLLHDGAESPADPSGLDRSQTVEALRILFAS